jgi:heme-degrading monooxygenase HmoA
MFVAIVQYPAIKQGEDGKFREWFSWSNEVFGKFDGFISRRLLKPKKGNGNYVGVVEHESEATFMAMHSSEEHKKAGERVIALFDGKPSPSFYEVIINSDTK